MFSKKQRIPRELFPKYTVPKNTWNGVYLRICFYNRIDTRTHFSVVVSKKQYKTIVSRNIFKRRVLSELEKHKHSIDSGGFDKYIIYPKGGIVKIEQKNIEQDINKFINECLK